MEIDSPITDPRDPRDPRAPRAPPNESDHQAAVFKTEALVRNSTLPSSRQVVEVGMGGYLLPSLPPSEYSTVLSSSFLGRPRPLPSPRATPLKPGSKHETSLIRFLDEGLLDVSRKYTKKYTPGGYDDIKTIVKDLQKLVDLIWISSTPTLQIQYLLQIANNFNDYLSSFALDLKVTFTFLDVLDRCFYALITGNSANPDSTPISMPIASTTFSTTEKVRLNSIIQRTRLHLVRIIDEGPSNLPESENPEEHLPADVDSAPESASGGETPSTDITDANMGDNEEDEEEEEEEVEWEMALARIYELSLNEVGEQLQRTG